MPFLQSLSGMCAKLRRSQHNPGVRIHPAVQDAPAGEHERVRAVLVDDRELKVAVEGSG